MRHLQRQRQLRFADRAAPTVVHLVHALLQAAIATQADISHQDVDASPKGGAHQRRPAVLRDVKARARAGLDVRVNLEAARDVGSPTDIAAGVAERLGEVQNVYARRGRHSRRSPRLV
jgi:hypothetical protein